MSHETKPLGDRFLADLANAEEPLSQSSIDGYRSLMRRLASKCPKVPVNFPAFKRYLDDTGKATLETMRRRHDFANRFFNSELVHDLGIPNPCDRIARPGKIVITAAAATTPAIDPQPSDGPVAVTRVLADLISTTLLVEEYLEDCRDRGLSDNTIKEYRNSLTLLVECCPAFPVTTEDIKPIFREKAKPWRKRSRQQSTKRKIRRALNVFFRWAGKKYDIPNPCPGLGRWPPPLQLRRFYSLEEIKAIMAAVRSDLEYVLVVLILDTGLRIGEVASLRVSSIVDDGLVVRGKRGGRRVPASLEVIALLRHIARGNRIWWGEEGPLETRHLAEACRVAIERAGITGKGRGPHTLRHTFATWYIKKGGSLLALQKIFGHKNIVHTIIYLHLSGVDVQGDHTDHSPSVTLGLVPVSGSRIGTRVTLSTSPEALDAISIRRDVSRDEPRAYGRHYWIKPLERRPPTMRRHIQEALDAFHNWRRQQGEDPGAEPWQAPPPDASTLRVYLEKVNMCSQAWRERSRAALRLYLKAHRRPDLFRMV